MDFRERGPDLLEIIRSAVDAHIRNVMTSIPVKVVKDSDGHTAVLQPLVKSVFRQPDGSDKLVAFPTIQDAPVHFASGGGTAKTHPVKTGDEGMAVVSMRSIDNWHQEGDIRQPSDARTHSLSDSVYVPGVRSDPRKIKDVNTEAAETRSEDGKHRIITHPTNGVKMSVANGKQVLDVNAVTGALEAVAKTLTLKSGTTTPGAPVNTANTTDKDLNNQLRGLAARVAQHDEHIAGLHSVASKLRQNIESILPALVPVNVGNQVTAILNKLPSGLDAMATDVAGQAQAYLQKSVEQALAKFTTPTLGALTSLLGGTLEADIASLQSQIANLISANPILSQIDDLQRQIDAVFTRGASAIVQAGQLAPLQDAIAKLSSENPAVATLKSLQSQLSSLLQTAGGGLDFLGPQKRLVQGVIKSLHLAES